MLSWGFSGFSSYPGAAKQAHQQNETQKKKKFRYDFQEHGSAPRKPHKTIGKQRCTYITKYSSTHTHLIVS